MRQFTETPRTLRMSLIDIAKVLKQAVTEIWVMSRENLRYLHFNNKGADQPAQTRKLVSDFVVQSLESIIDKLVTSKISAF